MISAFDVFSAQRTFVVTRDHFKEKFMFDHVFMLDRVLVVHSSGRAVLVFSEFLSNACADKKEKYMYRDLAEQDMAVEEFSSPNFHFHFDFLDHGDHYSWSRPPAIQ